MVECAEKRIPMPLQTSHEVSLCSLCVPLNGYLIITAGDIVSSESATIDSDMVDAMIFLKKNVNLLDINDKLT